MSALKYVAVIICAIVALAIIAPFFAERTPESYVLANNEAIRMQPTATAAALANQSEAIRVSIIVPAQATAEAASILANNAQRISEDAHQQALRHQGEMAALSISNTARLNEIEENYTARVEGIKAGGAKEVAEANADASRASAGAWRDTLTYGGAAVGVVILLVGVTLAIVVWLMTRAKIVDHPITGPMIISSRGVVLLGNVTTPLIAWNSQKFITAGDSVMPLVAQRQAFALIGRASHSDNPDMARDATRDAASTVRQIYAPAPLLDSAVQALPAGRDDLAVRIPTFAQLLQAWQPTRQQMLLGIDPQGGPVHCALEDLLSTGIIGRPRTGKSTLLRFIYLQCRLIGAQVVVWDLHLTVAGDLPGAQAFTELTDINQSANQMCTLIDRRIKARDYAAQPVMIMADEFNLLAPNSQPVTEAMGRIILEGRKVNMFAMISGQGLPANLFGGSTPRDALSSRFVMHTTTRQAQMVGLDREYVPLVVDLKPGTAIVDGPIDPTILSIPNTTEADLQVLSPRSNMVSRAASAMVSEPLPDDFQMASAEAGNPVETRENNSAEAGKDTLVRDLLLQGKSQREIIDEIWGQSGGRGYQQAAVELNDILRRLVQ
jgi:hypothetical protein